MAGVRELTFWLVEGIFSLDMTSANNMINGAAKGSTADSSSALPVDAIQEFNTHQNAPAEAGWKDGSVVNVGIKSGTNALHGTAYAFGRDAAATDAANYFTQRLPRQRWRILGHSRRAASLRTSSSGSSALKVSASKSAA